MKDGKIFGVLIGLFFIVLVIVVLIAPSAVKEYKELESKPRFITELFTDTDGCTYKIISSPSNLNLSGVVLVGCVQ